MDVKQRKDRKEEFIVQAKTFPLGRFTVRRGPLEERPGLYGSWPRFDVYLEGNLIGALLSHPSISDCENMIRAEHKFEPKTLIKRRAFSILPHKG